MKNEMIEESIVGVVSMFEILKNLTLIKKYSFEKMRLQLEHLTILKELIKLSGI